jgi:chemotaxis protein MotB
MNRISELENAIAMMDQSISDFREKLLKLRSDSEEKEKIIAALRTELGSKDTLISDFKEKLEIARSQLASLKNELARGEKEIEMLRRSLADAQGKSAQLRIRLDQIKSTQSDIVSELRNQIQNKEVTIEELEEKLSITFMDRVLFKSGSATITSKGRDVLIRV